MSHPNTFLLRKYFVFAYLLALGFLVKDYLTNDMTRMEFYLLLPALAFLVSVVLDIILPDSTRRSRVPLSRDVYGREKPPGPKPQSQPYGEPLPWQFGNGSQITRVETPLEGDRKATVQTTDDRIYLDPRVLGDYDTDYPHPTKTDA